MRSAGQGSGASAWNGNSPGSPYMLTICGVPLNPVNDSRFAGMVFDFGP